jgi:N-acetylmuramoyl-L-alanine amidase
MGARYLTDLAAVLRAAGLEVIEEPGWQSRARGSGGYESGRPTHVMIHHTASGAGSDGQADVNYCCYGSSDAPLANLYLSRAGTVWVMAAGATNTNGAGTDSWGGGVPDDSMNTHAVGIEAANNGTGEVWPAVQQDAYAVMVQALQDAYLIPTSNVREHAEWAPGRKIDPAGPSRWATSGTWNGAAFRSDVAAGWPGPDTPPPLPPPEETPMTYILESTVNDSTRGQMVLCDAGTVRSIGGGEKNALGAEHVAKYAISSATEWSMLMASRTVKVDVI